MKKFVSLAVFLAASCLPFFSCSRQAIAESFTMTITGTGGASAGGYYIYPYYFTIQAGNNSSSQVGLMCINFDREIVIGETWTANEVTAASLGTQYEEAAYLYSAAFAAPNVDAAADAQWAAWYLFDPAAGDIDPADGHNISALLTTAALKAALYGNYDVYLPVDGTQSWGGPPQIFIGDGEPPFAAAPEPGSLLLLGTGIFGLAFVFYSKKRGAKEAARA